MNAKKKVILGSFILSCTVVGASLIVSRHWHNSSVKTFTKYELSLNSGKNGKPCYVALDGVVYEIKQGNKWVNGEHTMSNKKAYCGNDLTEIIKKSPHGKTILSVLTKVGTLK